MKTLITSLVLTALLCSSTAAATVGGITLPKTRGDLELSGAGLLRKGFIFKIYVGALYVAEPEHTRNILSNVPKRIDIHYFHHTPKKHMLRVADETLQNNLTDEQYEALLPKIGKLHDVFRDGKKGSCASILYEPGKGLTYTFDDQPVITIPGDDFANAYFSIWLGKQPSSQRMKEAMLNQG